MSEEEASAALSLAIGKLFRIASRPAQEGDVGAYLHLRGVALDAAEVLRISANVPNRSWAAQRNCGAQGD